MFEENDHFLMFENFGYRYQRRQQEIVNSCGIANIAAEIEILEDR